MNYMHQKQDSINHISVNNNKSWWAVDMLFAVCESYNICPLSLGADSSMVNKLAKTDALWYKPEVREMAIKKFWQSIAAQWTNWFVQKKRVDRLLNLFGQISCATFYSILIIPVAIRKENKFNSIARNIYNHLVMFHGVWPDEVLKTVACTNDVYKYSFVLHRYNLNIPKD
jgi:hypothetical protein